MKHLCSGDEGHERLPRASSEGALCLLTESRSHDLMPFSSTGFLASDWSVLNVRKSRRETGKKS